jgi:hypothetical protein
VLHHLVPPPLCNLNECPGRADYDPEFSMGDHMFRDLALSRDSMTEYHKRLGPERAAEQRLTTMVLQQSFWPFSSRGAQDAVIPTSVCLLSVSDRRRPLTYANRCRQSSTLSQHFTMRSTRATRSSGITLSVRSPYGHTLQWGRRSFPCHCIRPLCCYSSTT